MKSILEDMYHGHYVPIERNRPRDPEFATISARISDLKKHFDSILYLEDMELFDELNDLSTQSSAIAEIDAYSYGFTMGVLLMQSVNSFKEERLTFKATEMEG
jgi:hypothetical protein